MTVRVNHNDLFATLVAMALAACPATPVLAGGVNAGTLIENAATATYEGPGGTTKIASNTVFLMIDEVLDVTVTSRDAGPVSAAAGTAVLSFELTNPGNGPEAYRIAAEPADSGNDFEADLVGVAVDANGNGAYEPGIDDLLPAPQTTVPVDPDQMLTVFLLIEVPADTPDGQRYAVNLVATAATGTGSPGTIFSGQGANGVDAIVGTRGADSRAAGELEVGATTVSLTKSASLPDDHAATGAETGDTVSFALVAEVVGKGEVTDLSVTDAIPDGTTYAAGSLTLDGTPLTDAAGDDAGEAGADGIAVALGTVAGGTSHQITFAVTVD